jgi:hypothetical protein
MQCLCALSVTPSRLYPITMSRVSSERFRDIEFIIVEDITGGRRQFG